MSSNDDLPFLPGNQFKNHQQKNFHLSNSLNFKNGYPLPTKPKYGIGGADLPQLELPKLDCDVPEFDNDKMRIDNAKNSKNTTLETNFVPGHLAFDKKVLKFDAYFKEAVHESPNEYYRVRPVEIYYYLEDDSIAVVEPVVENSGMPQGKLIKRQRLPKNDQGGTWHWTDLNIAMNVVFYGRTFRIINCDKFTTDFLESEGKELLEKESIPMDPYTESRKQPLRSYDTPTDFDKLKKFLDLDRKVLRFYVLWDDQDAMFGETRKYLIHYFLVDDSVEIREVHQPNDGRDPFPVLLRRGKLPKNRYDVESSFPMAVMELTEHEVNAWFGPSDFRVGETLFINGRKFLIYDCDDFTRQHYNEEFGIEQAANLFNQTGKTTMPTDKPTPVIHNNIPPFNGFGSLQDSLQNCLSLVPQPPKKDFIKMLENDGCVLRYEAKMSSSRTEDRDRRFIISYWLSNDTVSIFEPQQRNSGIIGGKFLERTRIQKPECDPENPVFYGIGDFAIGATIYVLKHRFVVTNADEFVLKHLEKSPGSYPAETIRSLQEKLSKH
jgi:hypothetical protein